MILRKMTTERPSFFRGCVFHDFACMHATAVKTRGPILRVIQLPPSLRDINVELAMGYNVRVGARRWYGGTGVVPDVAVWREGICGQRRPCGFR